MVPSRLSTTQRVILPSVAVAFVAMCAAPTALAYVALSTDGFDRFRWAGSEPVPWTLDPRGSDDVPFAALEASVAAAFRAWEDIECASITFTASGTAERSDDGVVHIAFDEEAWDPTVGDAAAVTETYRDRHNRIERAFVRFNGVDMRWSTSGVASGDPTVVDLQGVATHEIGHAIGLAHSRERAATMFFAGGESGNRVLHEDDVRGACFLYPARPFDSGRSCDSCDADLHCADGGCLHFPDQGGFCAAACDDASPCPLDFACLTVGDGPRRCLPASGHCDEGGANVPLGAYCYGDVTCASGLCLVTEESALCAATCSPTDPSACPAEGRCVAFGPVGFCAVPGPLSLGAPCDSHSDCREALCLETLDGGACSAPCSDESPCPDGARCVDGVCLAPGPRPLGTTCGSHFDCASSLCVAAPGETFCSAECTPTTAPCPDGARCILYGSTGYCRVTETPQPEGGRCATPADCRDGLACHPGDAEGAWARCVRPCDPATDAGCAAGEACAMEADGRGACTTPSGAAEGEACGPADGACGAGLLCVLDAGRRGACHRDCRVSDGVGCAAPEVCRAPEEDPDALGACTATAAPPRVWRPGDPLPPVGVPLPTEAPDGVVPIDEAEPPSAGGCGFVPQRNRTGLGDLRLDTGAMLVLPWFLLAARRARRGSPLDRLRREGRWTAPRS